MSHSGLRLHSGPAIDLNQARAANIEDGSVSDPQDGMPGKLIRRSSNRNFTAAPPGRSDVPMQDSAGAVHQRWAVERHGDMLLSRIEFNRWDRLEDIDAVLAQFALTPNKPQAIGSRVRPFLKALLGVVLLTAAAGAGMYGHVILRHAKEFFTAPTTAAVDAIPKSAPLAVAVPKATVPVIAAPAPAAPIRVSLEDAIGTIVNQMRGTLPKKIDALTSMVSVGNEATTIIYENQIAMDGTKIDNAKKDRLRQLIRANTCNTPGPRRLLELGVSFRYMYIDLNAKPVMTVDVTNQSCI